MTTQITIQRQEIAADARRIARKLRKLARRAAREDIELNISVDPIAEDLTGVAEGLTSGRDLYCHCGAVALEMVYWPGTGRTTMAGTLDALMRGEEMAAHPVCIEHARDSYVGHPLCPCGGRGRLRRNAVAARAEERSVDTTPTCGSSTTSGPTCCVRTARSGRTARRWFRGRTAGRAPSRAGCWTRCSAGCGSWRAWATARPRRST